MISTVTWIFVFVCLTFLFSRKIMSINMGVSLNICEVKLFLSIHLMIEVAHCSWFSVWLNRRTLQESAEPTRHKPSKGSEEFRLSSISITFGSPKVDGGLVTRVTLFGLQYQAVCVQRFDTLKKIITDIWKPIRYMFWLVVCETINSRGHFTNMTNFFQIILVKNWGLFMSHTFSQK